MQSLAIDPKVSSIIYAGLRGQGVFKSTDGGANWSNSSTGLPLSSIGALAIDPVNSLVAYVGTGSAGLFKSINGGATWLNANSGLPTTFGFFFRITSILIDPSLPTTLYVSYTDSSSPAGIFKTSDGGLTWKAMNSGLSNTAVDALVMDPGNSSILYAGTAAFPPPGGVFKSTDGGATWKLVLDSNNAGDILSLAPDPASSATIYAGLNIPTGGVFKSIDSGASWRSYGLGETSIAALALGPVNLVAGGADIANFFPGSGGSDAFATVFDSTGSALLFSTYYGGTGFDQASGIGLAPAAAPPASHAGFGIEGSGGPDDFFFDLFGVRQDRGDEDSGLPGKASLLPDAHDRDGGSAVSVGTPPPAMADLAVTKESDSHFGTSVGETVTFTVTLTNKGPSAAKNAILIDTLPSNFDFNSISAVSSSSDKPGINRTEGLVGLSIENVPSGSTIVLTITAKAKKQG